MKNTIITASLLAIICLASACAGNHHSGPGVDSTGANIATNPYRDTFKTTNTFGEATMVDNSGSGGTGIAKAKDGAMPAKEMAMAAPADTAKKDTAK